MIIEPTARGLTDRPVQIRCPKCRSLSLTLPAGLRISLAARGAEQRREALTCIQCGAETKVPVE